MSKDIKHAKHAICQTCIVAWETDTAITQLTMHDMTVHECIERAMEHGYTFPTGFVKKHFIKSRWLYVNGILNNGRHVRGVLGGLL